MMEKPIFEIMNISGVHIKIYANGNVEGFEGVVINRFPEAISKVLEASAEASAEAMEMCANEIRRIEVKI